uniref:FXNA-like protease n=1 Tax=Plectus sambesii TaxID=2011161 RepID=A0A914WX58_9BILA
MLRLRKGKEKKEKAEESGSGTSHSDDNEEISENLLGSRHWLLLIALVVGIVWTAIYCNHRLPEALGPTADNDRFSETRALAILKRVSVLGPRPSGSKTLEEDVTKMIIDELNAINAAAAKSQHRLEIVTHRPSGCFDIPPFDVDGMTICYKNVSNIIARLGAKSRNWQQSQTSVLINCHYDSQPMSPGATDDFISCSVMLEMLRVLTDKQRSPVPVDVIFLFNGAEETGLQGAHGFITTHPWRHGVRAFFNLEGAGAGGRELLFQAGPGNQWLLNSYLEAAERPFCSVFGQEVFQSGFVPSDTDFRVLRDYGFIPGLDIAYIQNGYVYHTEFDQFRMIPPGSVQRAGDNILATLTHLLHSPYLETAGVTDERRFVFFDVLGFFTIVYSLEIGQAVNYLVTILILVKIIFNTRKRMLTEIFVQISEK